MKFWKSASGEILLCSVLAIIVIQPSAQAVELSYTQSSGTYNFSGRFNQLSDRRADNNYKLPTIIGLTSTYLRSEIDASYRIYQTSSSVGDNNGQGYSGINVETVVFDPMNSYDIYGNDTTVITERNGTLYPARYVTHSGTINEEDVFAVESSINAQYSYGDPGTRLGHAIVTVTQEVQHYYDVDPDSSLYKAAAWLDDVSQIDISAEIKQKIIDSLKSDHINETKKKKTYFRERPCNPTGGCQRASIDFDGTSIFTASPGTLAYDLTLPEGDFFTLPFAFGENKDNATLEVFFNDDLLGSVNGVDFELDELSFLELAITDYSGMSGSLELVLNTAGLDSANVFIPDSIASSYVSAVPVPAAVWLFGSGLIGLVGFARRKKI